VSDIHALSGAYAVDALDDLERARFETHLAVCPECQAEVASLHEATGMLAETTLAEPPAELRDRVLADIATVRPLPPLTTTVETPDQAGRRPRRLRLVALAAAAAVLAAVGVGVVTQPWSDNTSQAPSVAQQVLTAADARSTSLDFDDGAKATVTRSDSVGKAVIVTEKMPPPPSGMVYQLWLDQPGVGMTSAGVMPIEADMTYVLEGDAATAKAAGITVEPEGGSPHPTSTPIALFDFGDSA
jgi:anti-sigma-K factor RskA